MPVLPKPDYCRPCALYGNGMGFSSLEGYGDSGLMVVAEALGEQEEEDGLPLRPHAPSGGLFNRASSRESAIDRQSLTLTNIVRCRPPDNELWGHPYTYPAIDHCAKYLHEAVAQRKPKFILALGDTPYMQLAADVPGTLSEIRGFVLPSRYGIPMMATYHPAFIVRGQWKLYGAFKRDVAMAHWMAVNGVPKQVETNYDLHPSDSGIRDFLDWLRANPTAPFSYDVETAGILGEVEPDDWRLKRLIQIQFSVRSGHAIVLPWVGCGDEASNIIFRLPNPRWGWNSRLSDDIILEANGIPVTAQARANGFTKGGIGLYRPDERPTIQPGSTSETEMDGRVGGVHSEGTGSFGPGAAHDLMLAWAHLQPDFSSKGDDRDGDEKGIPSKLMGLQSAASFYCPEVGPWKHKASANLQLYGAYDSDITYRCGVGIFGELDALGLNDGYREHKYELRWVLDDLGNHGLPVDRGKQAELRAYAVAELAKLQAEMHAGVPPEVLSIHPKNGYKALHSRVSLVTEGSEPDTWPKASLRELLAEYDANKPPLVMAAGHVGYLVQRDFETPDEKCSNIRPCIERLYNPHASSPNTKSYIRAKGYRMPVSLATGNETTGRNELRKLAKETGDRVLALTDTWRELRKTGLDYTTGKWVPGEDGRIHPTFRCGTTGSGQTSCTDPNAQQYPEHSGIAKRAKEAIRAEPGHLFVKVDMRGFHSRAIGWLTGDADYYRLADFDVHSYITAHFVHHQAAGQLSEMDDDELRSVLKAIKRDHTYERNYKIKRVVHGRQFNMGVNKLYDMHADDFNPNEAQMIAEVGEEKWFGWDKDRQITEVTKRGRAESRQLFYMFDELFPLVFLVYPRKVEEQLRNQMCRLTTPFGHHRYIWNRDLEQGAAFGPSNCAHCHIQSAFIRMRYSGALARYGGANFTHDAGWFHPTYELVDACVGEVQEELERPSVVLVDSPLGPFQCNSDAEVGPDLAHMVGYSEWVKAGRPTAEQWKEVFPDDGE